MVLSSYIKSAYRNVFSNKLYTLINVLGLAIGIICSIYIYLYVSDELSFDTHWKNYKRIYRLESLLELNGKKDDAALTSFPLAPVMAEEIPEIASYSRFSNVGYTLMKANSIEFYESKLFIADSSALNIFDLNITKRGNTPLLSEPNTMVISEKLAKKYFGKGDAINHTVILDNDMKVRVTGIFRDIPQNSHLAFDALISMSSLSKLYNDTLVNSRAPKRFWSLNTYSYILLKPNASITAVEKGFTKVFDKYMAPTAKTINARFHLKTTRLDRTHFFAHVSWDLPSGNISTIYIFIAIGIFIILIACINYMNLATARAANRAKEVGIRKVLGSDKKDIFYQFMSESILLTLFSLFFALAFIEISLPLFNALADKSITLASMKQLSNICWIALIALGTGIISGSYPALYLASFQPAQILKNKFSNSKKNGFVRKTLVVFQFTISIILISGTFIIWDQMHYVRKKNLGFVKENLVVLRLRDTTLMKKAEAFKSELRKSKLVPAISLSYSRIGEASNMLVMRIEHNGKMQEQTVNFVIADYDYIKTMGIGLIQGRDFDSTNRKDAKGSLIINEAAMRKFGWTGNPIGKKIRLGAVSDNEKDSAYTVIGVVKDFNYKSLHNTIEPIVMAVGVNYNSHINIRIDSRRQKEVLDFIAKKWALFFPKYPFDYQFLDYHLKESYSADYKMSSLFSYFAIVCIFIAAMGLFGLSSYIAEQRRKEIAVRKVVGASMFEIFRIIYREFFTLISLSLIIATPLSYFLAKLWLRNFAYQIEPGWYPFVYAALFAYTIAIITVFYHAYRIAKENPANILKYE